MSVDTLTHKDAQGTNIRPQIIRVSVKQHKDTHRGAAHPQLTFLSTSCQPTTSLPPPPCSPSEIPVCCSHSPLSLAVAFSKAHSVSMEMGWGGSALIVGPLHMHLGLLGCPSYFVSSPEACMGQRTDKECSHTLGLDIRKLNSSFSVLSSCLL